MKYIFILLLKIFKKALFVDWTGYDLNHKSIDYIIGHYRLFEMTKNVPGHIIELGTGSGRNSLIFGRLIKINQQEKYKKVYGFDTFEGYPKEVLQSNDNFSSESHRKFNYKDVKLRMEQNQIGDVVSLIKGILPKSVEEFLISDTYAFSKNNLKISLIYVDCNDFETAKNSLLILKDYLSTGSIIAIDENRLGGETKALEYISKELKQPIKQWKQGGVISSYMKIV